MNVATHEQQFNGDAQFFQGNDAHRQMVEMGMATEEQVSRMRSPEAQAYSGNGTLLSNEAMKEYMLANGMATEEQFAARSTRIADHHKDGRARDGDIEALSRTPELRGAIEGLEKGMKEGSYAKAISEEGQSKGQTRG